MSVSREKYTFLWKMAFFVQIAYRWYFSIVFIFENYPSKNLEIRQFIRIFAENLAPRAKSPKQGPNTLVIITNKPKISLTELHKLDIEKASVDATDRTVILQGSERNSACIVRLLSVYCA